MTLVKDASVRNYQHQQSIGTLEIAYKVVVHLKLSEIIRAVGYKCHLKIVCLLLKYSKKYSHTSRFVDLFVGSKVGKNNCCFDLSPNSFHMYL